MIVLLIDDHAMFREGVIYLLNPLVDPLDCWQAGSCEEAFDLLSSRPAPDLVLIDLALPGMSGFEGLEDLRERLSDTPPEALSSSDDRDTVLAALDAGAVGFIPKCSHGSVLVGALRLILEGCLPAAQRLPARSDARPARSAGTCGRPRPGRGLLPASRRHPMVRRLTPSRRRAAGHPTWASQRGSPMCSIRSCRASR
jgi:DNA-binding NarL/FixJ family response regulator